jgi:hypothetical protein
MCDECLRIELKKTLGFGNGAMSSYLNMGSKEVQEVKGLN